MSATSWWSRFTRHGDEQLHKELRFHIEEHATALIAEGVPPDEARRRAQLALGGVEQVKEQLRDVRPTRWLDDISQDVRFALRTLARRPGFAAVVVAAIALGAGATTVMFTVINGVLLKPLAFPEPDRLVELQEQTDFSTQFGNRWAFSYPNYLDCERDVRSLTLAAFRFGGGTLSAPGDPEFLDGRQVSWRLFAMLGAPMVVGRSFLEEEDRAGAPPVAVISYGLWQRHFGGRPQAVGESVIFEGTPHTVIGVVSRGFQLGSEPDIFTPIGQNAEPRMRNREAHPGIQVWARLRPGAALADAQSELTVIGRRLAGAYPESNAGRSFVAEPLRPFVGDVGPTLWLLLTAVSLVLLIACANVASLLLARAVSRDRELAMRAALGAGRARLVRQCLTESAVLGLFGGALGILIASAGVGPFLALWPGSLPRASEVAMDWHVLAFALSVSLASGFLFGLAPALRVPARDLEGLLRAGARSVGAHSQRLHAGFVIAEIALAIVLLVGAGVLGRTLLRLSSLDPGVDVNNVLVTRMAVSPSALSAPARARAAWDDVLERIRRAPGTQAAALVDTVPMRDGNNQLGYWTSAALPPRNQQPFALATSVTPDYLQVMRIPLRQGRFFGADDRSTSEHVIVIDEVLAQQAFNSRDAVGRQLWVPDMGAGPFTVVGVVGHVRHWGMAGDDQAVVRVQLYYPFSQLPDRLVRRWSELMSVAIRTTVPPLTIVDLLRHELRGAAGDQVLYEVRTMEQLASGTLARQRFLLMLFAVFAGVALLLACIGIYGVLAYLTSQRVPEIGVRMALGATRLHVMRLVLGQSLGMILVGVGLGTLGAIAAAQLLRRFVEGVRSTEPSTFVMMIAVLVGAALLASFLPARRASRVDAMTALRQE